MKTVKITSLGASITLSAAHTELNCPCTENKIEFLPSLGEPASFLTCRAPSALPLPDIVRTLKIYLSSVMGLPYGEYEISVNGRIVPIILSKKNQGYYGSFFGKCKLLFPKLEIKSDVFPLECNEIITEIGSFRVFECEDVKNLSLLSVAPAVCREFGRHEPPLGAAAFSLDGNSCELAFYRFGYGAAVPNGYALSAVAAFLLEARKSLDEISFPLYSAFVRRYNGGLYVYTDSCQIEEIT